MANNATSILQIEVQDEQFKEFEAAFHRYQENAARDVLAPTSKHIKALPNEIREATRAMGRFNEAARASNSLVGALSMGIGGAIGLAAKLAAAIGLVALAVGKEGANSAKTAGDLRKRAKALNLDIGQMEALDTYYSKTLDSGSGTAEKILASKNDLAQKHLFSTIGVDINASPDDQVQQATMGVKNIIERGGDNGIALAKGAYNADQWFSDDELNRIKNTSREELEQQARDAKAHTALLNISDPAARKGQELAQTTEMSGKAWTNRKAETESAGFKMEQAGVEALAGVAPKIESAADEFIEGAKEVHNAGEAFKLGVDTLVKALPDSVMSPEAKKKAIDTPFFADPDKGEKSDLPEVWRQLKEWATTPLWGKGSKDDTETGWGKGSKDDTETGWGKGSKDDTETGLGKGSKDDTETGWGDKEGKPILKNIRDTYEKFLPKYGDEMAANMAADDYIESGGNPRAIGDGGKAVGAFQHHKNRRDDINAHFNRDMFKTHDDELKGLDWEITHTERDAMGKAVGDKNKFGRYVERSADLAKRDREEAATVRMLRNRGVIPGHGGTFNINLVGQPASDISTATASVAAVR